MKEGKKERKGGRAKGKKGGKDRRKKGENERTKRTEERTKGEKEEQRDEVLSGGESGGQAEAAVPTLGLPDPRFRASAKTYGSSR